MIRFSELSLVDYIDITDGLRDSNMRNWPLGNINIGDIQKARGNFMAV